jgi:hypothetical protein
MNDIPLTTPLRPLPKPAHSDGNKPIVPLFFHFERRTFTPASLLDHENQLQSLKGVGLALVFVTKVRTVYENPCGLFVRLVRLVTQHARLGSGDSAQRKSLDRKFGISYEHMEGRSPTWFWLRFLCCLLCFCWTQQFSRNKLFRR